MPIIFQRRLLVLVVVLFFLRLFFLFLEIGLDVIQMAIGISSLWMNTLANIPTVVAVGKGREKEGERDKTYVVRECDAEDDDDVTALP